ncbi:MAG TPA: hypothetical protein VI306_24285 [Pyrinomonadaceae bacterium]
MKRFWIILAGVFAGIAVALFLRGDYEKAFVSATIGSVSWFLSYRVQMQALVKENEPPEPIDDDDWETDEEEQD